MTRVTTMMALGSFRFGFAGDAPAYQELVRVHEYRWRQVDRAGRRPGMQFVGQGPETITLPGVIYPEFRGGFDQMDAMRALAGQGEPLHLVDATGKVWGQYCIVRIKEKQSHFRADAKPRKVEFEVELKHYGEDA